ncbi:MAG: SprT family zinc-dependent metalloprotease [Caulobacteraceae bacterium]
MNLFRGQSYAPGDLIEVAGARVRLKVSPRAQRVSLRIDQTRREVIASAPSQRRLHEAVAFAGQRAHWIAAHINALPGPITVGPGDVIDVFGQPHRLEPAQSRLKAGFYEGEDGHAALRAFGEGEAFARSVVRLLKRHALQVLEQRTGVHAAALGQPMPKVAVADAKGRWGSCRPARPASRAGKGDTGSIRYSWRLVLAPFEVADYVAAHECAHLLEANHGPKFWAHVRRIQGSEKGPRAWLRQNGARLHAFGRPG